MIWTYKEKKKSLWERWFAWYSVPIGKFPLQDGTQMVWLEWVERKFINYRGSKAYEYRLPKKDIVDGCICQECGTNYVTDVLVSDELWEKIKPLDKPQGTGLLCGHCILDKLEFMKQTTYILKEVSK